MSFMDGLVIGFLAGFIFGCIVATLLILAYTYKDMYD